MICFGIGYLFGLFQTGYLYGRLKNRDIRTMGSGNAGTTNALRTLGVKAGILTLLGDSIKCICAVFCVYLLFRKGSGTELPLLFFYTGAGAVIGHNYPFYLNFKGGKGIAATGGLILSTLPLPWFFLCFGIFVGIIALTRYVSLGSLGMVIAYSLTVFFYGRRGGFGVTPNHLKEIYWIVGFLLCLAIFKHKENLQRLLQGRENKLSFKKKVEGKVG